MFFKNFHGFYFSIFLFLHNIFALLLIFFITFLIEVRLPEKVTMQSSIAQEAFNYATTKVVKNIHDAEHDRRQRKDFEGLDDPLEHFSENSNWKIQKISEKKKPKIQAANF